LFGTTTIQIATLFVRWGEEQTNSFMDGIRKNEVKISTSNGESADLVAAGEFAFSLVDSDDAVNRMRQGRAVEMILPDQGDADIGALVLPNATVLIHGAPHPDEAKILIDYLLSKDTERKLAFADCAQIPLRSDVERPGDVPMMEDIKAMELDYAAVAREMRRVMPVLKSWMDSWE
jgi:iron(III) transport system substrate-binding protein